MDEEMTIDDTVNIVNVAHDCVAQDTDDVMRELAIAAKRSLATSTSCHASSSASEHFEGDSREERPGLWAAIG